MQFNKKVIILGAGPIGLYFANKCEEKKIEYLLVEGSDQIGGQLTHLYPEKEIVDIPGHKPVKAKDYIAELGNKINNSNIVLNEHVLSIVPGEHIKLLTKNNEYECEYLVIATGLGTSVPRPLGVEHEDEVKNILYNLSDYSFLKDKHIAIFGGGDSALDWAKYLSAISDNVHLIHRRLEFRGNPETIKDCKNLHIHLPYVPKSIEISGDFAKSITIQKVESEEIVTLPVDYIFVNYGNIAKQSNFPFKMQGAFLVVNESLEASKNIFAIGDVAQYENKTRRIAPGNKEADKVLKFII